MGAITAKLEREGDRDDTSKRGRPVGKPKTGGRKKGTPKQSDSGSSRKNSRHLDCDPLEGMARIAMDEKNSPELRGRIQRAAQYLYPKRKPVDVSVGETHSNERDH